MKCICMNLVSHCHTGNCTKNQLVNISNPINVINQQNQMTHKVPVIHVTKKPVKVIFFLQNIYFNLPITFTLTRFFALSKWKLLVFRIWPCVTASVSWPTISSEILPRVMSNYKHEMSLRFLGEGKLNTEVKWFLHISVPGGRLPYITATLCPSFSNSMHTL